MGRFLSIGLVTWLGACGASHPPDSEPYELAFLHPGVDVATEALAERASLERTGATLAQTAEARGVTVLAFTRSADASSALRVVTRRGVAYFVDAGPELDPVEVGLAMPPGDHLPDLDGDGVPEVLVRARARGAARACITVVRLDGTGSAAAMTLDTSSFGHAACVEDVDDIDDDGRAELVIVRRFPELAGRDMPEVAVPVNLGTDGVASPTPWREYFHAAVDRVREELGTARRAFDVESVYRCAIEIAANTYYAHDGNAAAVRAFDDAMSGIVLTERVAAAVRHARDVISAGFPPT